MMTDEFSSGGITKTLKLVFYLCSDVLDNDTLLQACSAILRWFLNFGIFYHVNAEPMGDGSAAGGFLRTKIWILFALWLHMGIGISFPACCMRHNEELSTSMVYNLVCCAWYFMPYSAMLRTR